MGGWTMADLHALDIDEYLALLKLARDGKLSRGLF